MIFVPIFAIWCNAYLFGESNKWLVDFSIIIFVKLAFNLGYWLLWVYLHDKFPQAVFLYPLFCVAYICNYDLFEFTPFMIPFTILLFVLELSDPPNKT